MVPTLACVVVLVPPLCDVAWHLYAVSSLANEPPAEVVCVFTMPQTLGAYHSSVEVAMPLVASVVVKLRT